MKKIILIVLLLSMILNVTGCVFESKELKRIKAIATSYAYTREDCELLNKKQNDKEVQRWLEEVAKKIQNREYSSVNISALTSYLESADVKHPEVDKQIRGFYADVMKEEKEKAFATSDPVAVIEYAKEVEKMRKKVPAEDVESYLPHDELAKYIRDNCTLTISKRGAGGFYDEVADDYQNKRWTEEGSSSKLTLTRSKSLYYDFAGDYMLRRYVNKVRRETGDEWEEEILKDLDYESLAIWYKGTEVRMGEESFALLPKSEVYVYPDEKSYIVFIIQENQILALGKNKGFDLEYSTK